MERKIKITIPILASRSKVFIHSLGKSVEVEMRKVKSHLTESFRMIMHRSPESVGRINCRKLHLQQLIFQALADGSFKDVSHRLCMAEGL